MYHFDTFDSKCIIMIQIESLINTYQKFNLTHSSLFTNVNQEVGIGPTDNVQEEEMLNRVVKLDKGLRYERSKVISTYLYGLLF